jgi:hypothetical protein
MIIKHNVHTHTRTLLIDYSRTHILYIYICIMYINIFIRYEIFFFIL